MVIKEEYEIEQTIGFVLKNGYKRVALQFPDNLLHISASVSHLLKTNLPPSIEVFILADSTYGPLSVNTVDAQHLQADCLVHYGPACFTEVTTLPVFYVLQKFDLDIDRACVALFENVKEYHSPDSKVQIFVDQAHIHQFVEIKNTIQGLFQRPLPSIQISWPILDCSVKGSANTISASAPSKIESEPSSAALNFNRRTAGYLWLDVSKISDASTLVKDNSDSDNGSNSEDEQTFSTVEDLSSQVLVWIGFANSPSFETLQLCSSGYSWLSIDTTSSSKSLTASSSDASPQLSPYPCTRGSDVRLDRLLRRRYFLVEKARQANIVGILVGTLAAAGYLDVVRALHRMARAAGKRAYTFLVGKPTPAKLANFPEVDVFVHVTGAEGLILETKDFLSPVVGAYEAAIGFLDLTVTDVRSVFNPDFKAVLDLESRHLPPPSPSPRGACDRKEEEGAKGEKEEGEEGLEKKDSSIAPTAASANEDGEGGDSNSYSDAESKQVVALGDMMRSTEKLQLAAQCPSRAITAHSAAEYLHLKRTYQGLEIPKEKLEPSLAVEGLSGRAAVYDNNLDRRSKD